MITIHSSTNCSYCSKRPMAMKCLNNFILEVESCFTNTEMPHKETFVNMLSNLFNVACRENNTQLTYFNGGQDTECINRKAVNLLSCLSTILISFNPNDTSVVLEDLPQIIMDLNYASK